MNKAGFSLVIFLVYLALSALIISCLFTSTIYFIIPTLHTMKVHKEYISLQLAADLFVKEIRMSTISEWKEISAHCIIWNNEDTDIGWVFHDNKLERIQGIYRKGEWDRSRKSLVAKGVTSMTVSPDYHNGKIRAIGLVLVGSHMKKQIYSCVAIRHKGGDV